MEDFLNRCSVLIPPLLTVEGFDFGRVHFGGVAFVVKEDEAFYPGDVGFLGTEGVVLGAEDIAYLV